MEYVIILYDTIVQHYIHLLDGKLVGKASWRFGTIKDGTYLYTYKKNE